eukprot:m.807726 g.807726  ORF g.807726 m.807726 type:complete len:119 (-) comp23380_c0_seq2:133-489(-)
MLLWFDLLLKLDCERVKDPTPASLRMPFSDRVKFVGAWPRAFFSAEAICFADDVLADLCASAFGPHMAVENIPCPKQIESEWELGLLMVIGDIAKTRTAQKFVLSNHALSEIDDSENR